MTAPAVVEGVALALAAAGVGDYATDRVLNPDMVPITVALSPDSDGPAITVTTYPGGPEPDSRNGWEYPRLQVRVRAEDPLAALDLDRACFDALQFTPDGPRPRWLPGDAWFLQDCHALQSEAQPLGQDANGRSEYVRNYQLAVEPAPPF
ncbi:minor capsid protein [Nocardioides sp. R1-1]|uniref:minor capsid protein n=1 Tax=Nocardioides sp. R1-1 TaxID=3383502 RepID=UPI0038CFC6BA